MALSDHHDMALADRASVVRVGRRFLGPRASSDVYGWPAIAAGRSARVRRIRQASKSIPHVCGIFFRPVRRHRCDAGRYKAIGKREALVGDMGVAEALA